MTIPEFLQADFTALNERWRDTELDPWRLVLAHHCERGMSAQRYGDIPRWHQALKDLPTLDPGDHSTQCASGGLSGAYTRHTARRLRNRAAISTTLAQGAF